MIEDIRPWQTGDADTRCQFCGGKYAPWFTDNWLWNYVASGGSQSEADPGGYSCQRCFALAAEVVAPNIVWRLTPEAQFDLPGGAT